MISSRDGGLVGECLRRPVAMGAELSVASRHGLIRVDVPDRKAARVPAGSSRARGPRGGSHGSVPPALGLSLGHASALAGIAHAGSHRRSLPDPLRIQSTPWTHPPTRRLAAPGARVGNAGP